MGGTIPVNRRLLTEENFYCVSYLFSHIYLSLDGYTTKNTPFLKILELIVTPYLNESEEIIRKPLAGIEIEHTDCKMEGKERKGNQIKGRKKREGKQRK